MLITFVITAVFFVSGTTATSLGLRKSNNQQPQVWNMDANLDLLDASAAREYQCGSERGSPKVPCKGCSTARTCYCDGFVKFGSGTTWSGWMNSSGTIECSSSVFGDPLPGANKVCLCRPQVFTCATEWTRPWANCPECTMTSTCRCNGFVRFGYGPSWTSWAPIAGSVECKTRRFGDPLPGHGKVCQCMPTDLLVGAPGVAAAPLPSTGNNFLLAIIIVTTAYFTVYVSLAMARSVNQFSKDAHRMAEWVLTMGASSVYLAPMLCALFFVARKRADFLTFGNPDFYGYPPQYLEVAALLTAIAFCFQAFFQFVAEYIAMREGGLDLQDSPPEPRSLINASPTGVQQPVAHLSRKLKFWTAMYHIAVAVMHVGVIVVICGVWSLQEPSSLIESEGYRPIATGTMCTLVLAVPYFVVYLILHFLKIRDLSTYGNDLGSASYSSFGMEVMRLAATAMNFAPMLCVLFMATQIAMDWQGMTESKLAKACIYVCTFAVFAQVLLVLSAPLMSDAELEAVAGPGEVDFVTRNRRSFMLISFVRWAAMMSLYAGIFTLCAQLWMLDVPSLAHLISCLSGIYFATYLLLWVSITGRVLLGTGLTRAIMIFTAVKETVSFCPMLSVLILESFVRARRVTNKYGQVGVPQSYAQDLMQVAVIAVVAQLVLTLVSGVISRVPVGTPPDLEQEKPDETAPFCSALFHMATLVFFISVCAVLRAIFTVTPENATGIGAWLV